MNYKDGRTLKKYYCMDCNKIISIEHKRCKSCAAKLRTGERSNCYKNGKWIKTVCKDCGKKINPNCERCKSCAQKGKRNHNYINGQNLSPYSSEFNDRLKLEIRERDNYTCQISGITEEEHLIIYGEVLTIHHIDYNKDNNHPDNLISLSRESHTRTNFNREYWQDYFTKILIGN